MTFPKPYADVVARWRVFCGFALAVAFVWLSHPAPRSLALGLPVALAGLALRAWAAGYLHKDQALSTGGPYAYTRNPLYVGTLVATAGLAMAARSLLLAALFALVFVAAYLPAIQLEEQHLRSLFPEYAAYTARVPALWPRSSGARSPHHFEWALYWKNREYHAALGFLAGVMILLWKARH